VRDLDLASVLADDFFCELDDIKALVVQFRETGCEVLDTENMEGGIPCYGPPVMKWSMSFLDCGFTPSPIMNGYNQEGTMGTNGPAELYFTLFVAIPITILLLLTIPVFISL